MAGMEGRRLGAYELLARIGGGGMAEVYRARQLTAFGRQVAIKVIRPGFSEDPAFRERFLREAQAISRLSHPNILPLIEFGEQDEILYLVMPLAREGTLRDRLQQQGGALPWEEAAPLFVQLCAAVHYAHEEGLIHRDLKPQNVLLQERTHVLLADFGIARDTAEAQHMTTTGAGIGTVEYMAPEQAMGQATKQSDLYSLGIVLYQLLTGRVPYTGSTPFQVLNQHVNAPLPDPRLLTPRLSGELVQVLRSALEKDPQRRFQSAQALSHAVEQVRPHATHNRPTRTSPTRSPTPFMMPSSSATHQTTRPGQDFWGKVVDPEVPTHPGGSPPSRPSGITGTLAGRQRPLPLSNERDNIGPVNDDQPIRNTQGDRTAKTAPGWQQQEHTGPLPYAGSQFPPQSVPRRRQGLLLSALVAALLVLLITLVGIADPLGLFSNSSGRQVAQQATRTTASQQTTTTTAPQQATTTAASQQATTTTGPQPTITGTASTTTTPTPTRTATPTFTPTPTFTATPVPTFKVTGVSAAVSPGSWDPPCIDFASFDFTATITVNSAPSNRTITYYWTFSDGSSYVPTSVTVPASSTSITASANWTFTSPPPDGAYWGKIVVTAPNSITSNQATFTIAC